jgi:hypothetical protein
MTLADRNVIAIEEITISVVKRPIVRKITGQDESFKEPGRMRKMPFGWAGIRHRLDYIVFGCERFAQSLREITYFAVVG